ncbi:MAG: hypothetical protein JXA11_05835 [Phycisphaerae bacterium]|nr:hypothetical protein [Phycisphaerae bacterium]
MNWEEQPDGCLTFAPLFDHERGTRNRQLTHWHFRLFGQKGIEITLRIPPMRNIYGDQVVNAFADRVASVISGDGVEWSTFFFHLQPDESLEARVTLPADEVTIARVHPYTIRDLDRLLSRHDTDPVFSVEEIGKSVEGRPLHMIRLSAGQAGLRAFFRGRAHPWEAGGNWFLEGLIREACEHPALLENLDIHILPMAAIDGVARGLTRFNVHGYDLNRGFTQPHAFSADTAPENLALIDWLEQRRRDDTLPHFAMDIHNDDHGNLHAGDLDRDPEFCRRITLMESLMRRDTWYTEGMKRGAGVATFGEGLRHLFGIDSVVHELNTNWLAGADRVPTASVWLEFGAQFLRMLPEFMRKAYGT